MRSRPDYPIINPVESVLISDKLPTKLLASTTPLVESKHEQEKDSPLFTSPSEDCLKKLQKICPIDAKSVGSDPNANLRAFIIVVFSSVFNSQDDFQQNLLVEKITNQVPNLIKTSNIINHKHQEMSFQNIIKVISGFLKTLSNKKLKNPQNFDLLNQFENLSIILDYIIIIFRAILDHYGQENANDFAKIVEYNQSYGILSEYFDINFIQKDHFYLFEENSLFIYKEGSEYVFGHYQSSGSNQVKKQKPGHKIQPKYEENCRIQIMECSMESGSMMVSSRHGQESTPYFNALVGEQFVFRSNERKQGSNADHIKDRKLQEIEESKISQKCFDSKGSQFQVNIFSEDKNQFLNNRYKSGNRSENSKHNDSNLGNQSAKTPKESSFLKFQKKKDKKVYMSNNTQSPKSISPIKKVSSDKCFNPSSFIETQNRQKTDSQKIKKSNQNTEMTADKETIVNKDNQTMASKKDHDCYQDKTFPWQNEERRLRRVQTICYKTCSTCHRRFYRNEIQLNVLQITIVATPKIDQNKELIAKKGQIVTIKHTPQFLNNKLNKKIVQIYPKIQSPRNVQNSPRHNLKDQAKLPQLSWLSKRTKNQNQINQEAKTPDAISNNVKLSAQLPLKTDSESPKKILSAKNLFIKSKQPKESLNTAEQDLVKLMNTNQNKRLSCEKKQPQPKLKSFFALKSQKELQKIKSIDKCDFFKGKISKDGVFTNQKSPNTTLQMKNHEQPKENTYLGKYGKNRKLGQNLQKKVTIGIGKDQKETKTQEKNKIQATKSEQRRVPHFVKKDFLNTAFDLILNN